jgi:hypothetical protein
VNVSELISKTNNVTNNNTSMYNHSFLYVNQNMKGEVKQNQNHSKSRDNSTSVNKQNSFDCNPTKVRKAEHSSNQYSKYNHNSSQKEENKSINKSGITEKVENSTSTNNTNNSNLTSGVNKRGSINLGGISILKRLSNKKSLNLDLKNMYKIDLNYKKLSNMNISISGLND